MRVVAKGVFSGGGTRAPTRRRRRRRTEEKKKKKKKSRAMSAPPPPPPPKEEEEEGTTTKRTTKSTIDFLSACGKLKRTLRTGWTKYPGIRSVESVAEHSFRIALMAFVFGTQEEKTEDDDDDDDDDGLDVQKLVTLALVHDISECIVGDITPHCGVTKEEKNRLEVEAMRTLKETLGSDMGGETIERLWLEYENGSSREARVVKELDKLEMLLQASEYENEHRDVDLTEFYASCDGSFKTERAKRWVEEIMRRRPLR